MLGILQKLHTPWAAFIVIICLYQVQCQKNLTACDPKINANDQSPCCLNGCDAIAGQNWTQACECPANMTLQNVTNSALYNCAGFGNNATNSSVKAGFMFICWNTCPNGTYIEEGITSRKCSPCNDECTTCSGAGIATDVCDCKQFVYNSQCVSGCSDGFYGDENKSCVKCDSLCRSCKGAGTDLSVCTCKFQFNKTCVESCPNGTSNVNGICSKPSKSSENDNVVIIIAAAAGGGGAFIIIVIVVVVICCCRKKKRNRTRMSTIIEERDAPDDKDKEYNPENIQLPTKKSKNNKRPDYVNIAGQDDVRVAKKAQLALDKKYRYVKDPTETMKNKQKRETDSDPEYHNQETINRQKNIRDKGVFKAVSKKWKKSKKAVKNRFSKNMSDPKKGSANQGYEDDPSTTRDTHYFPMGSKNQMRPEVGQQEYLDLEAAQQSNANTAFQQEDYEPFDTGVGSRGATSADVHVEQEDYMNVDYNTRKNDEEGDFEQELYENYDPNVRKDIAYNEEDATDQEDYENYDPKNSNIQNTSSTGNENDDSYEEEDYENAPSKHNNGDREHSYVNVAKYSRRH